jgi:predicted branched-subunit amino acid permease
VLGTEVSLFAVWNVTTFIGALVGGVIPDPERLGVDFVFPVAFIAILVPLIGRRVDLAVAVGAGATAWLLANWLPGGVPVLGAGVSGALLGAWLTK